VTAAATLTDVELDAAWELLGLGRPPAALTLRSPGRDATERQRVLADTLDGLRRRGLADAGGLCAPLAAALRVVARPGYRVDLRVAGLAVPPALVLASVAGEHAVLITQCQRRLTVAPLRPVDLGAALVDVAGPFTPGAARPVTLDAGVLDDALSDAASTPSELAESLCVRGLDQADANAVAHIYRDVHTLGQVGATGFPGGRARRAPWVVAFHHNRLGSFMQLRRPNPDRSGATVTMAPLDADRLLRRTAELVWMVTEGTAHAA
jgi:hypothetical protein